MAVAYVQTLYVDDLPEGQDDPMDEDAEPLQPRTAVGFALAGGQNQITGGGEGRHVEGCISVGPWGGSGGSGNEWHDKAKGDITKIIIVHGWAIHSILFKSHNDDGSLEYSNKFGGQAGMQLNQQGSFFSFPMEGGVIVGFHGRACQFLDAIGVYVKPLSSVSGYENY
ncbi:hypothetical protein F0562_015624 [Nyssa sinensis]|uniref:Jacalin-type lectin domain-containing protein n=1 Tax=Nyssa sinensis TaxID=561372 RepID=A0A5J4ZHT6_9ASTE|nr:hypothetical protein F0562_015624 [Nyssa sinensis]